MKTGKMTAIALVTAVTCVLAPLSVPIGPVPVSLTNLVLYFSVYILGTKYALVSYTVYCLLGLAGAPVFSGFRGGFAHLFGATGGYIIGFLPMVLIIGLAVQYTDNRYAQVCAMFLGTSVAYAFGTAWYCVITGSALLPALFLCVFPFVPFDMLKMTAAVIAAPILCARLREAGIRLPSTWDRAL